MKKVRFRGSLEKDDHQAYDIMVVLFIMVIALFSVIEPTPETHYDVESTSHVVQDQYQLALGKLQGIKSAEEGLKICNKVTREDDCFLRVAKITNESGVCDRISQTRKADLCYMYFVNEHDYSVCDKIHSGHIKKSCFSLQNLQNLKKSENVTHQ